MFLLFTAWSAIAGSTDAIETISSRWKALQIQREHNELYVTQIIDNADDHPYAAVGNYQRTIRCFRIRTGENPYPSDTPIMITVAEDVSAPSYRGEFMLSDDGILQFATVGEC